jgi:AcrR family transcriptional regulator
MGARVESDGPGTTRVGRDPAARRRLLLDRAQELFFARGYDATSVEDVLAAAGSSKGAFYHHFASKEALLEAIAERLAAQSVAQAGDVLADPGLGALDRLNAFLAGSRRLKLDAAPLVRRTLPVIFRPENVALRHRITAATITRVAPALAAIIAQGCQEGVFDTPDPLGTAELLLHLGTAAHDTIVRAIAQADRGETEEAAALLEGRLRLVEVAFNRVLGLPDHAVSLAEPGFAAAVLRAAPVEG